MYQQLIRYLVEDHGFIGGIFKAAGKLVRTLLGGKDPKPPPTPPSAPQPPPPPPQPAPVGMAVNTEAGRQEALIRQRNQRGRQHRTMLRQAGMGASPFATGSPLGGTGRLG